MTKKATTRKTTTTRRTASRRTTTRKAVPEENVAKEAVTSSVSSEERVARLTELWRNKPGIIGWLSAVDHKSIGSRYIFTGLVFFVLAGIAALLMRTQLIKPENTFLNADQYNRLFTVHGLTMMFLFAVPIMLGVGIYFVPLMVGARDVPFPKANAFGYYIYMFAGAILWLSLILGAAPDGGWFAYTPLSEVRYTPSYGMDIYQQLINGTEVAALIAASELIILIFKFRAPGMSLNRIPMFVWAMLVTSFMVEFAMPSVMIATNLLGFDRSINTNFFNPNLGGDPLMWQHLFWFFGHPEVYIIFIPGLGMVSEILGTFTRRAVVGYSLLVISLVTIGVFSFGLWVHHMFTTGLPSMGLSLFTVASMVISVPSGIQIFSGLATLWHGKLNLKTPLLYVLGFMFVFVIGGISGVMIASVPFDMQAQDSYFVVAHLHYVLIGGAVFPLLGAIYYWFPKMTGKMMDDRLGQWNFWLTIIGFNVAFFPMHLTGLYGMPRRMYTYLPGLGWDTLNFISTIGSYIIGVGVLLFAINVIKSLLRGEQAPDNPWGGGTLEWATTSPPQPYNFANLPVVESRYPVWDAPAAVDNYVFEESLDRRETLDTTTLDAVPEMRVHLPGNTIVPFIAAVIFSLWLLSQMFKIYWVTIFSFAFLAALVPWFWPRRHEWSMKWVKAAPPGALQISTVAESKTKPPVYYGTFLMILIETVEVLGLIACYFYLRSGTNDWPPSDMPRPQLLLPIIGTILLIASAIPSYLDDIAVKKNDQRGLRIYILLQMVLVAGYVAALSWHLRLLNFKWDANAYASIYWILILSGVIFAALMIFESLYVLVLAYRGFYNPERHWGIEVDGLSTYFTIGQWILIFLVVYISPYLMK